jgi:hypothetical protein
MEPEGSLPHSQQPATYPYPEPYQSCPCPPHPTSWRSILILSSHLRLGLGHCHKWPWPIQAPYVPSSKSHVPFPLLKSYQRISPGQRLCIVFRNMVIFYGEELLALRQTPKLEDHPLLAVRDCIFAATLHIRRPFLHPQPEDTPCHGDRDPLIMAHGSQFHENTLKSAVHVW